MAEISITEMTDDELALLATHGALEADRFAAHVERLRRAAAEARTARQQHALLADLKDQDAPSPYDLIDYYCAPVVIVPRATTPRQQCDILSQVVNQDAPSPFRLIPNEPGKDAK